MRKPNTEKMMATNAANKERFDAQTLQVDDNWRIIRFDEYNWQVQRKTDGKWQPYPSGGGYFGKLPDALKSLPGSMLNFGAANSLASLYETMESISELVEAASNRAEFAS